MTSTNLQIVQRKQGVTWRAVLISLALIPINHYWVFQLEVIRYSWPTYLVPFYNVIFSLLVLTAGNLLLIRFTPKIALNHGELLTIYIILSISSALGSHNMMQILVTLMGHAFWFATPENDWQNLFWRYLPPWLTVRDKKVLAGYYEGGSTLYTTEHITGWILPVLMWWVFIMVLVFVMLCITVVIRRAWTEHERLSYPIIQLPYEMTAPEGGFFRNRLMWTGFAIAGIISIINGLGYLFPTIPTIPVTRRSIQRYFTQRPWNAIGEFHIAFYPFGIGIAFLVPLTLSFSLWIFYIFYKAELIIGSMIGRSPGFPYTSEQSLGAYVGIFAVALWTTRGHIKKILLSFIGRKKIDDSNEPLRYRTALFGIGIGLTFLILFSVHAGMSPWVAPIFFGIYFLIAITVTRIRAEMGFPVHDMLAYPLRTMFNITPQSTLVRIFGTRKFSSSTLTLFSLFFWFNRTYASHPMPHQLEGFKLASRTKMDSKRVVFAILLAAAIGALVFFWIALHIYYRLGAESGRMNVWSLGFGDQAFRLFLQNWIYYRSGPNYEGIAFMGIGFAMALLFMVLRLRFFWWPLHPLGYAISGSLGMRELWLSFLISSCIKWIIVKYRGFSGYRHTVPFFLGLILGDFTLGSFWSILGIVLGIRTYDFWP